MKAPSAANFASGQTSLLQALNANSKQENIGDSHSLGDMSTDLPNDAIGRVCLARRTEFRADQTHEGSAGIDDEMISKNFPVMNSTVSLFCKSSS